MKLSGPATGYSHLKISLLQDSFVGELWIQIGKQTYLEDIHSLVVSNLHNAPDKGSAAAASVLLIGSSEELGMPITIHQTIMPLIQCLEEDFVLMGLMPWLELVYSYCSIVQWSFWENFIVRKIFPLLKSVVHSSVDVSFVNKPEPVQSWVALAFIDCFMTLDDGVAAVLPIEEIVKKLIEMNLEMPVLKVLSGFKLTAYLSSSAPTKRSDGEKLKSSFEMSASFPKVDTFNRKTLRQIMVFNGFPSYKQLNEEKSRMLVHARTQGRVAAASLISVCQWVGADSTALHVLPQLKEAQCKREIEIVNGSGPLGRRLRVAKQKVNEEAQIETHMDLVFVLYPSLSSLLGIEKLGQCCVTWLLLEQFLLRNHGWKEYTGESSRAAAEVVSTKKPAFRSSALECYPAKLLLNRVGWSILQSQGSRGPKNSWLLKGFTNCIKNQFKGMCLHQIMELMNPGFGFLVQLLAGMDLIFLVRSIYCILCSCHHGALRSLVVCPDELTILTAGVGPGFKGTAQKWDLTRVDCVSGCYGHEEIVNDIRVLSSSGRIASCDGTLHVWNSLTGKLISVFAESSVHSAHNASPSSPASKVIVDQANMLNSNTLLGGILNCAFDGSFYTCLHHLEHTEKLVVGSGNDSLMLYKAKNYIYGRASRLNQVFLLLCQISSSGTGKAQTDEAASSPAWIAAGFSSGICKLLDARSGNVIASWRAHDGYITKLVTWWHHKTICLFPVLMTKLCGNYPPVSTVFTGDAVGVSGFSLWGHDNGKLSLTPQKLYNADSGMRNLSMLSSISILPFS
ncbi:hypothetical protein RJ641_032513, partial [Dillenia turbinata]